MNHFAKSDCGFIYDSRHAIKEISWNMWIVKCGTTREDIARTSFEDISHSGDAVPRFDIHKLSVLIRRILSFHDG